MEDLNKKNIRRYPLGIAHPIQRILLGMVLSGFTYLMIPEGVFSNLLELMIIWIVFSASFNISSWILLFNSPLEGIRKAARQDDGSKLFVLFMILISSIASLCTVFLLMVSRNENAYGNGFYFSVMVLGMLLSWAMVHTIFTFHYAHMYYDDASGEPEIAAGLTFPGGVQPDYLDFAYFSFVIGCTFQVSDVEINSKIFRRWVLLHSLLAFLLNTFVVALTINLISGFNK